MTHTHGRFTDAWHQASVAAEFLLSPGTGMQARKIAALTGELACQHIRLLRLLEHQHARWWVLHLCNLFVTLGYWCRFWCLRMRGAADELALLNTAALWTRISVQTLHHGGKRDMHWLSCSPF
jgi:hypothetical protein